MGTEIPLVEYDKKAGNTPTYAYYSTKLSLDEAKAAFERVKELSIQLSMIENAAIRLATNIKKTQKRANALKNITIPRYETLTRDITNALEEKEREEFTRLKVIQTYRKQNKLKKSSADLSGSAEDFFGYPHLSTPENDFSTPCSDRFNWALFFFILISIHPIVPLLNRLVFQEFTHYYLIIYFYSFVLCLFCNKFYDI